MVIDMSMNILMDDSRVDEIFRKVGDKYGYKYITARFEPYSDFKVRWNRSFTRAEFMVSDYLYDAPDNLLEDLAEKLFAQFTSAKRIPYTDELRNYLVSPEFFNGHRDMYIKRMIDDVNRNPEGQVYDLNDSVNRLMSRGVVDPEFIKTIRFMWVSNRRSDQPHHESVLFRTVTINDTLDDEEVSEDVLDAVVFDAYIRVKNSVKHFGDDVSEDELHEGVDDYPDYDELMTKAVYLCL
jgi:hypothetical protein